MLMVGKATALERVHTLKSDMDVAESRLVIVHVSVTNE